MEQLIHLGAVKGSACSFSVALLSQGSYRRGDFVYQLWPPLPLKKPLSTGGIAKMSIAITAS